MLPLIYRAIDFNANTSLKDIDRDYIVLSLAMDWNPYLGVSLEPKKEQLRKVYEAAASRGTVAQRQGASYSRIPFYTLTQTT